MSEPNSSNGRLCQKYIITKANGEQVDPNAVYFVLRVDKDIHARKALKAYADSLKEENYPLAIDIVCLLNTLV